MLRAVRISDTRFWSYIDLLGRQANDTEPLVAALARTGTRHIRGFEEALARHLYDLDLYELFTQGWQNPADAAAQRLRFSNDTFLYTRADAVVAGRHFYEHVLADHAAFQSTPDLGGEAVLYVAQQAWARRTGRDEDGWNYETRYSYETGNNAKGGWPEADLEAPMPFTVRIRHDDLSFFTPRIDVGETHGEFVTKVLAPRISRAATDLLLEHGGPPPRLAFVELHILPGDRWDLAIVRRDWPMDMRRRKESNWQAIAPFHRQLAVVTPKLEIATWSEEEKERGIRGIAGFMLAEDLARDAPGHPAIPALREWHALTADLLPAAP